MSRTDRNILILGLLIIVLVVVGYYFLLLSPLLGTLDARAQERSTKESELASLQQEVAQLEAAKRNAPETERVARARQSGCLPSPRYPRS